MSEEHLLSFDKLDINTKRNQISNELLAIKEIIKNLEKFNEIESMLNVKNYDQNNDFSMSEGEMLTFFYEDIYNIEQELITLLTFVNNQKNRDI